MPTRGIPGRVACRVGEDDYRELQALGLVHRHYPNTLGAFLNDGSLVSLATFGIRLEFLDKGAEGGCAYFEMSRHVSQPLAVGEGLLASRPESHAGMRPYGCKQHGNGLGDWAPVPADVKLSAEGASVANPAFDVTPARLVSAIVTEEGVHRPPYERSLRAALGAGP